MARLRAYTSVLSVMQVMQKKGLLGVGEGAGRIWAPCLPSQGIAGADCGALASSGW